MIRVLFGLLATALLIAVGIIALERNGSKDVPFAKIAAPVPPAPPSMHPSGAATLPPKVTAGDTQTYRSAQEAAFRASPDLQAQYRNIINAMKAHQNNWQTAMLKADPKLGPVLAKLHSVQDSKGASSSSSPPTSKPVAVRDSSLASLTASDRLELRSAQERALKTDPGLAQEGNDLRAKMNAFEDTLDADMLKTHPQLAPLVAKFESARDHPSVVVTQPAAK